MARIPFDLAGKRVWVAGHSGMVGSALVRRLHTENCEILKVERQVLDLRRESAVHNWMRVNKPDVIILAAAKVGGILANETFPAEFLYENLMIQANTIHTAYKNGVEKLLFLGSSCIYPKFASQPINEDALLSGSLEPTNEWYATAKIAGVKLCQAYRKQYGCDFISAMPTNLYGPGDNFDLQTSHVLPALIRKAHEGNSSNADTVTVWGTGTPRREFLHVDDCADALIFLLKNYSRVSHINVGIGDDISIEELARMTMDIVGFRGRLVFDSSKPDGTPRKLMSNDLLKSLGWTAKISLRDGIQTTSDWFAEHYKIV